MFLTNPFPGIWIVSMDNKTSMYFLWVIGLKVDYILLDLLFED